MAEKIVVPDGGKVVWALCDAIVGAKAYLSEIDGAIGDGDHGANMAKGFALAKGRISEGDSLPDALEILGDTLLDDIGGSMGPICGTLFMSLSDGISDGADGDDVGLGETLTQAVKDVENLAGAAEAGWKSTEGMVARPDWASAARGTWMPVLPCATSSFRP